MFLTSPNIKLDWSPGAWLDNKLSIDSLTADRVTLIRLPKLKPSTSKRPILPGFDIHIGELTIGRLDIGPEVSGKPRSGRLWGKADVHSGRALVELQALMNNGGDRIAFHLDAEPDRNKFDLARAGDRARGRAGSRDDRDRGAPSISRFWAKGTGRGGEGRRRSIFRAVRLLAWRSESTMGCIASRASGRPRRSSRASCSG